MKYALKPIPLLIACMLASQHASAEEESSTIRLDSVIVIGNPDLAGDTSLAGSVDVITREELEYESVTDTLELFSKVPGVTLSRFNQGIINTDISIRGFAGDGSTPHGKLLIDGIPSNLHNGYNELDQLFPLAIESIQVFKGTSDPTVGLFATAGNYRVNTRKDVAKTIELTYGSFDTRELQAYLGDKQGDFTQNYSVGYRKANGFRDNTNVEKIAVSGRWQYDFEKTSLALSTRYGRYEADSPGYLSREERRNRRRSADFADQDGGEKSTRQVSVHLDHFHSETLDFSLKAYWQNFKRERWVRFSQAGALQNRFDDQTMQGAIATMRWQFADTWRLDAGLDTEHQDVIEQRFGTIGQQRVRNRAAVIRNFDYIFETQGAFVQIENTPLDYLRWNVGVRADRIDGRYKQFNAAGIASRRSIYDFGTIVQPKANVFLNVTENQMLFANAGRSFQHPFSNDAFTAGDRNARDVSINDGWEFGLKSIFFNRLNSRISFWQQRAQDEFVVVDGIGQNIGKTDRRGIELAADFTVNDQWSIWANYSKVSTELLKASDANQTFKGNEIRSIPDHTASLGVNYAWSNQLIMRMHVDRQGSYYVNEANLGGKFGDYTLVHASADYKTSWGKVSIQGNNLFDRFYEYVFDFSNNGTDTIHSPGAGRNFMVSASFDL